jgi:ADP-ribosylglycohydrolase
MHDVLDPRDLIPDEAEQLALSGFPVGSLMEEARTAAAANDLQLLASIEGRLGVLERDPEWPHQEPEDEETLLALCALAPRLPYDRDALRSRVKGGWLGRAVGNTLGKPIEGLPRDQVETYLRAADQWPLRSYLPLLDPLPTGVSALHTSAPLATAGRFDDVPRDDDLDWTILNLHVLEKYGREVRTEQIAEEWLNRVPFTQTYTAERAAYRNLIQGVPVPDTATRRNPYREWIGALIRGDVFGFVNPGNPGEAARLALVDARLTHTANGLYGELWAAALVAGALSTGSARTALEAALAVVPERSRLAAAVVRVMELHENGATSSAALDWVDDEFGQYSWVHTINNAALIAIGLLWGKSFIDAVGLAISGGRDTDSTAATVGSVYGCLHGADQIPAELVGTTHRRVRSAVRDFDRITIDELTERTLQQVPNS